MYWLHKTSCILLEELFELTALQSNSYCLRCLIRMHRLYLLKWQSIYCDIRQNPIYCIYDRIIIFIAIVPFYSTVFTVLTTINTPVETTLLLSSFHYYRGRYMLKYVKHKQSLQQH